MFDIDDFSAKEDGRFEASAELIEEIGSMSWGTIIMPARNPCQRLSVRFCQPCG